jgi:hypothetical protein
VTVVDRFVQAVSHGGTMTRPTLVVIHDAETPLAAGYANSIAVNWFGKAAQTSAHFMVDPAETIRMLSDNVVSYAVGPKANGFTLNIEQAGYAKFTRAQWATPAGMRQHTNVGALVRELCQAHAIPTRWASDQQIRDAARGIPGGVCYHDDIHRVLGGTTHTDPGPGYPRDLVPLTGPAVSALAQEDDLQPDERKMLQDIHTKTVAQRLPLAGRPGADTDDPYGHVLSADAAARQALAKVTALEKTVNAIAAALKVKP